MSVPPLNIPEPFRASLTLLEDLGDDQFDALHDTLRSHPPTTSRSRIVDTLAAKFFSARGDQAQRFVEMVIATSALPSLLDQPPEDVAVAIAQAVDRDDSSVLRSRLSKLLRIESLILRNKSQSLASDYQYALRDVRILTDIRPVFDETINVPTKAIVTHSLKLEYVGNRSETTYIALTTDGLNDLKNAVERALQKEQALHDLLMTFKFADLTPREENER